MDKKFDSNKIEELVMKIKGVISTKVVISDDGDIDELHLLTDDTRNPKQISRDVQSALASEFDFQIDHKVISIAQIEFTKDNFIKKRVRIESIAKKIKKDEINCSIVLSLADGSAEGTETLKNFLSQRDKVVVLATVKALEKLFNFENKIFIEAVETLNIKNSAVSLVLISVLFDKEEIFIGSSIIEKDKDLSLVRATLDAVNRKLNMF